MKLTILVVFLFGGLVASLPAEFEELANDPVAKPPPKASAARHYPIPWPYKDLIHTSCCVYMKARDYCKYPHIYKICQFTCGCYNRLSDCSCEILRGYGYCDTHSVVRAFCKRSCNVCPGCVIPSPFPLPTCRGVATGTTFKDPKTCAGYIECVHGKLLRRPCAKGTLYNHKIKVCDWPRNVECHV